MLALVSGILVAGICYGCLHSGVAGSLPGPDGSVGRGDGLQTTGRQAIMTSGKRLITCVPQVLKNYSAHIDTYVVVNTYPHDAGAFTQGLVFEEGVLYEGTGRYGHSTLRKVDLETGVVLQSLDLPSQFFGEGITIYEDKIVQLTWRSGVGFVYDRESFGLVQRFNYTTEGWGITHDGKRLIISDGTPTLHFWDPETFEETGRV